MDPRPPPAIGARTAAGGLTLTVHGLLVMVLLSEDRDLVRPLPASRAPAQVWINLASVQVSPLPAAPADRASEMSALPARAVTPPARGIATAPAPASTPQTGSDEQDPVASPADWELLARQRGGNYGREEIRTTFGEPLAKMREPCIARPLDSSTVALMDERLPQPRDLPVNSAPAQKIVQLGGARVGIVTIAGSNRRSVDTNSKSSFKWKWDDTSKGGIAALTPGWEEPPAYDGMFDDMQAGRTPSSSVPDPDFCD